MNARPTNVSAVVQLGSPRSSAMLPCPLFQMVSAEAVVRSTWIMVERTSQLRL
jgi:hypothetical protein